MLVISELFINVAASVILLGCGFVFGKFRERQLARGKNLEEYDFYPFVVDERNALQFDPKKFTEGVHYLLRHRDNTAAQQLVLIGEQNGVSDLFTGDDLAAYRKLYQKTGGDGIIDDNLQYLENYKRIVRLLGDTFPDVGIEILLHNLTNPSRALYHIKNNVTGRNVEAPATNLVLDLKTRRMQNKDKLNYELNIGARKFKCTTIPIYRRGYGLVGAVCVNVDVHFLQEAVKPDPAQLEAFFATLCRTDMELDENILSEAEYRKAIAGKRHFRDHAAV